MKKTAWGAILIVLIVLTVFGADYFLAMKHYDELRKGADSPLVKAVVIKQKEQEFLDEVQNSWTPHALSLPDDPIKKMCELTGFEPTVGGIYAMLTHEVPPFSMFDKNQNIKEAGRAGAFAQLKTVTTSKKAYWKEGVLYMMNGNDILLYFQDTDVGLKHIIYTKTKKPNKTSHSNTH